MISRVGINSRLKTHPVGTPIVFFGDSITEAGTTNTTTTFSFSTRGFTSWTSLIAGNPFYYFPTSNQGVSGTTTTNMLGRIGTVTALNPKLCVFLGGTNDLQNDYTLSTTINNLDQIFSTLNNAGITVVALTLLPRTDSMTAERITRRQQINSYIKSKSSSKIIVLDSELMGLSDSDFTDGLHPNAKGAYKIGSYVGTRIKKIVNKLVVKTILNSTTNYLTNPYMTGSTGSKGTGVSGTVASNWTVTRGGSSQTIAVSKATELDNSSSMIITIGGTQTGTSAVTMLQDITTGLPAEGDLIEGIVDVEILQDFSGIEFIYISVGCYNTGKTTLLKAGRSPYFTNDSEPWPIKSGNRITLRTTPITVPTGTAVINFSLSMEGMPGDGTTQVPISGAYKIHAAGIRKLTGV